MQKDVNQNVKAASPAPNPPAAHQVPKPVGSTINLFKKGLVLPKKIKTPLVIGITIIIFTLILIGLRNKFNGRVPGFGTSGEIVWWGFSEDAQAIEPLIQEYQSANPAVKIRYVKQSPQDYRERLSAAIKSGKGPDIFELHNTWKIMFSEDLDILPKNVMTQQEFNQIYYPVIVKDLTTSKGIVGIPLFYDSLTMFVNQDIFAAAAKDYPTTWNGIRAISPDLVSSNLGSSSQSAIAIGNMENVDHWPEILTALMLQNGVNLAKIDANKMADALSFYATMGKEGGWKNIFPTSTIAFAKGQTAVYLGPSSRSYDILKENPNIKFKTVLFPQVEKERSEDPDVTYATYWYQGVWKKSPAKEEAWKFLKFLSTPESLQKIQNGRTYEKPYPRIDMKRLQLEDPVVGSVIVLAPFAKSWYMASNTFDGDRGINSQISNLILQLQKDEKNNAEKISLSFTQQLPPLISKFNAK